MAELVGSISGPDLRPFDTYDGRVAVWLDRLELELKQKSPGEFVGRVLKWQRADGYARYVVVEQRPILKVAHLNVGDGWEVEPPLIRGLNIDDVSAMCRADAPGW